jgi:hypothetical protein
MTISTRGEDLARRSEVRQALKNMGETFRHCRRYGHHWRPLTAYRLARGRGWEETVRCPDCETTRFSQLDKDGDVVRNNYHYAEGYLIDGLGRLTGADRGQLRLVSIMDHLTGDA